jgi:transcriptional repressor NrdR
MHRLLKHTDRELSSRQLGILVMDELKKVDQVAYVRFASVYRKFQDVEEFREEIERLERDLPGLADAQMPLLDEPKKT